MSDELSEELSKLYISESDYDYILRECKSLGLIYRCPPAGVHFIDWDAIIYGFPQPSDKLKGVSMDDIAVRTKDGEAIYYLYINGSWLEKLKEADVLESTKESMKRQLVRCCQHHMWYHYVEELRRKWSSVGAPKQGHPEEGKA